MPSITYKVGGNVAPAVASFGQLTTASKAWKKATIADFQEVKRQMAQVKFGEQTAALRSIKGGSLTNVASQDQLRMVNERHAMQAKGGRGMSGTSIMGGIALQSQDVMVQLQGGAKAATVIAQQGSQIASLFGPHGAIIGGLLAGGAMIYTWVTGTAAAAKEAEALEKAYSRSLDVIRATKDEMLKNRTDADLSVIERLDGKEAADKARDEFARLEELKKLDEQKLEGRMSGQEFNDRAEQINRKYDERAKLREKQRSDEADKAHEKEKERLAASIENREELQKSIEGETDLAKAQRLRQKAAQIPTTGASGAEYSEREEKRLKLILEATQLEKKHADAVAEEKTKQQQAIADFRTEGEDSEMKHVRLLREQYEDIARSQKASGLEREKIISRMAERAVEIKRTEQEMDREIIDGREKDRLAAEQSAQKIKRQQAQALKNFGTAFSNSVQHQMMTPQQRQAERDEAKARARAERRVINREVNRLGTEQIGNGPERRRIRLPSAEEKQKLREQLQKQVRESKSQLEDDVKSCRASLTQLAQKIQVARKKAS